MPMPRMNLIGQKFERLMAIDYAGANNNKQSMFKCVCDCGNEITVLGFLLKRGNTKSCGCLRVEKGHQVGSKSKIHGMISTPTYNSWQSMKDRCSNKNNKHYRFYGGKGVTIDEKWNNFEAFLEDMGVRPEGTTLDRINPFGNYEMSNCRWADNKTQRSNTRKAYMRLSCQS